MSESGSLYLQALSNMRTKSDTMSSTEAYWLAIMRWKTFCMSIGFLITS